MRGTDRQRPPDRDKSYWWLEWLFPICVVITAAGVVLAIVAAL